MTREDDTLWTLLQLQARQHPDDPMLVDAGGTVTRAQLAGRAAAVAAGLRSAGVAPGDRVAVQAGNRREHVELLFALSALGAVYCPVHPGYVGESLRHAIDLLEPVLVVADAAHRPALAPALPGGVTVVALDPEPAGRQPAGPCPAGPADLCYAALAAAAPASLPPVDPGAPALILMTSGTTGRSKGVVISSRFAVSTGRVNARTRGITRADRLFSCYSFCHTNPHNFTLFPALVAGASMAWSERFSTTRFLSEVRALGATQFSLFTTTMLMLLGAPPTEADRAHGASACMSVGTPPGRGAEFEARFGVRIIEPYGMTECGPITVSSDVNGRRLGSSGRPVDEWTVAVMGPDGTLLPAGATGEIVGRPNERGMLMSGYYRNAEATAAAFADLWFHTGDLGRFDSDGFLWYAGRLGDVIRRRGENIAAADVERAARQYPGVLDAAAVAVPSPLGEDDLLLLLEVGEGPVDPGGVHARLARELPRYALPQYIRQLPEFPRTVTGRVTKKALAAVTDDTWHAPERKRKGATA